MKDRQSAMLTALQLHCKDCTVCGSWDQVWDWVQWRRCGLCRVHSGGKYSSVTGFSVSLVTRTMCKAVPIPHRTMLVVHRRATFYTAKYIVHKVPSYIARETEYVCTM